LPLQLSIFDMLEPHWPPPTVNRQVLNHGDYWPGNLLWLNGRLSGVVDWEDASLADPLADLANARLEFLWAYGADAMTAFTEIYLRQTNVVATHLPSWDLDAALRAAGAVAGWRLEAAKAAKMAIELEWFVAEAGAKLAG
jgi:aminoglycoside phosphotransferase (APT) family kinase protein